MGEKEKYCPLSIEIRGKIYCFKTLSIDKECNNCVNHELQRRTMVTTDHKRE